MQLTARHGSLLPSHLTDQKYCEIEVTKFKGGNGDTDRVFHWTYTHTPSSDNCQYFETIAIWKIKKKPTQ